MESEGTEGLLFDAQEGLRLLSELSAIGAESSGSRREAEGRSLMEGIDIQAIVRQAVQEFANSEKAKSEPAARVKHFETPGMGV